MGICYHGIAWKICNIWVTSETKNLDKERENIVSSHDCKNEKSKAFRMGYVGKKGVGLFSGQIAGIKKILL